MENFIFSHVIIAVAFPPTPDGNEDPEAVKVKPIEWQSGPRGDTGPREPGQIQIEPAHNTKPHQNSDRAWDSPALLPCYKHVLLVKRHCTTHYYVLAVHGPTEQPGLNAFVGRWPKEKSIPNFPHQKTTNLWMTCVWCRRWTCFEQNFLITAIIKYGWDMSVKQSWSVIIYIEDSRAL